MIPFSCEFEAKIAAMTPEDAKKYCESVSEPLVLCCCCASLCTMQHCVHWPPPHLQVGVKSAMPRIIKTVRGCVHLTVALA